MKNAPNSFGTSRTRWGAEPVHDALVEARMADLQARLHDPRGSAGAMPRPTPGGPPRKRSVRRVRLHLGHAIVALGAIIAGPHEHGDPSTMCTV